MTTKKAARIIIGLAALALCLDQSAAYEKASLRGRISDQQGSALRGAFLSLSSPQFIGVKNYLTPGSGRYFFVDLPPGTYRLAVEMPGFTSVIAENVVIHAGQNLILDFELEPSDIEETVTKKRPAAVEDLDSASFTTVIDNVLISRLPLARDLSAILGVMSAFVFEDELPGTAVSIHGAPYAANFITRDGINLTNPLTGESLSRVNPEVIEELVTETAAGPVASGPAQGGYIRIISFSGNNDFSGSTSLFHTARSYTNNLWTDEEVTEMGGPALPAPSRNTDFSLTLSGPIIEDFAWAFLNFRYRSLSYRAPFNDWADPFQLMHREFTFSDHSFSELIKLTGRLNEQLRINLQFDSGRISQPYFEKDLAYYRPGEATRSLKSEKSMAGMAGVEYALDRYTSVNFGLSFAQWKQPLMLNAESASRAQYHDAVSGFYWGSGDYNDLEKRNRLDFGVSIVRFQDRILGMLHRLSAGGEYETLSSSSSVWKTDPLFYYYSGNTAYLYGYAESPFSGNTVGKGLLGIRIAPEAEGGLSVKRNLKRLGVYAGDTVSIADRISLNFGIRYDRSEAEFLSVTKGSSGSDLAISIGESLVEPVVGYNPFSSVSLSAWNRAIVWNSISPRAGISIDLFGGGQTILKASYSRLPENLTLGYSHDFTPFPLFRTHLFDWYDEDGDAMASQNDYFSMLEDDYRIYKSEYYRQSIDPDLKAPVMNEWTAGIEQKLPGNLSVSARFINRTYENLVGYVTYDPSTGAHWYDADDSPAGWWVPFSTVVPGTGDYPDTPLTLYFPSTDAPNSFYRLENLPALSSTYKGLEISIKKKMSGNWQFFGTMTWARARGTANLASPWSTGTGLAVIDPNSFINITADSILATDRPFNLRLMGTYRLPLDIYFSAYFRSTGGTAWARTVTVIPPESWASSHGAVARPVSVYLETQGKRRHSSWQNLDIKVEKEFLHKGKTRFSLSFDVFNLLGDKYKIIDLNDGGLWFPNGEGGSSGARLISESYGKAVFLRGTRVFRIGLKLNF